MGYTMIDKRHGYAGVMHNLAGLLCFHIIRGKPTDQWVRTKIDPNGGTIQQPQYVCSWIAGGLMEHLQEIRAKMNSQMSNVQERRIIDNAKQSPPKRSMRIWERDCRLASSD